MSGSYGAFIDIFYQQAVIALGIFAFSLVRGAISDSPRVRETIVGLLFGVIAFPGILNPVILNGGKIVDSHMTLVVLATAFAGPLAGLVAMAETLGLHQVVRSTAVTSQIYLSSTVVIYLLSVAVRRRSVSKHSQFGSRDLVLLAFGTSAYSFGVTLIFFPVTSLSYVITVLLPAYLIIPLCIIIEGGILLRMERESEVTRDLAESEARFRAVVEHLPGALVIRSLAGRFLLANRQFCDQVGITAAEVPNLTRSAAWARVGVTPHIDLDGKVLGTRKAATLDAVPVTISGEERRLRLTVFPIWNEAGDIAAIGTHTIDVTDHWKARNEMATREETLRRHREAHQQLVQDDIFTDRPLIETIQRITKIAGGVLQVPFTSLWEFDSATGRGRTLDCWDSDAKQHFSVRDEDVGINFEFRAALQKDGVLAIADTSAERSFDYNRGALQKYGVSALLAAGVYLDGKLNGQLLFIERNAPRVWTEKETSFARSVADIVSWAYLANRYREAIAALDLVRQGIYLTDAEGVVLYANQTALRFAGAEATRLMRSPAELSALSFPQADGDADSSDAGVVSWRMGDETFYLRLRADRLPNGGRVTVITDSTQQIRQDRERDELQAGLSQARKVQAIGRLAGGVAHDFNNLIGAIRGFSVFLEQDLAEGSEQRGFARRITSACDRAKALTGQILAFARAQDVERACIDLRQPCREAFEMLRASLPSMTELKSSVGSEPLPCIGSDTQIGQLIVNLCTNANDAFSGRPGTISVTLSKSEPDPESFASLFEPQVAGGKQTAQISFGRLDPKRSYALLRVSDTGSGISRTSLARIFDPFFTTKARNRGTGLGLALVHSIVEGHDGACAVESALNVGTTFHVWLPLTDGVARLRSIGRSHGDEIRGGERILVVDDEPDVNDMLTIGLERLGYTVVGVTDPVDALEALKENPDAWDIVVTDEVMPKLRGSNLIRRLKKVKPSLGVILCTGYSETTTEDSARLAGADAFFLKPVEVSQIAACIRALTNSKVKILQEAEHTNRKFDYENIN